MDEPMLRVWMQEGVPPATCYRERAGRWVGEPVWPSPRIEPVVWPLGAARFAADAGEVSVCSPLWVGLGAGEIGRYGGDAEWPGDQREDDGGFLVWTSEPLPERLEILGAPRLRLMLRCDKPQALVAVRLNDVAPDGRSTRVTLGLLNLTHRDSHEFPAPLVPGEVFEAVVELDDIAHAFAPGHRVAVSLSTTYWPIAWPSPELATLRVVLGESALTLPVRSPRAGDANLRAFDPPESALQTPTIWHETAPSHPRRVVRELLSGRMTVDFPRWTYACEMTDIGQTVTSQGHARYEIIDGDPLSACLTTEYAVEMQRPDTTVGHWSKGRMTCDATHFSIEVDLRVSEGGVTLFENHWAERIARDCL